MQMSGDVVALGGAGTVGVLFNGECDVCAVCEQARRAPVSRDTL